MSRRTRRAWMSCLLLGTLAVVLAGGCNDVTPPTDCVGPECELPIPKSFRLFGIALRPISIERPTRTGRPTPFVDVYNLTAFYEGGTETARFQWTVPETIGTLEPKLPNLSLEDATVRLRPRLDGQLPLGVHEFQVRGHSGDKDTTITGTIAVVENTWMKHHRVQYVPPQVPEELVQAPVFMGHGDSIVYVESPSKNSTKIKRIPAFWPLDGQEQASTDVVQTPTSMLPGNNYATSQKLSPDPAPLSAARKEVLFSTDLDSLKGERTGTRRSPFNIWTVEIFRTTALKPRQLTFDQRREPGGLFYAFDYLKPRWDPNAGPDSSRIAFISNRTAAGANTDSLKLWIGWVVDTDSDGVSDRLDIQPRGLASTVGLTNYAWDPAPNSNRICFAQMGKLHWVDVNMDVAETIELQPGVVDPQQRLAGIEFPSVYAGDGQTLIAFQAVQSSIELFSNLYVFDVQTRALTRLLPYSVATSVHMYPRWHPTRKQIVYISDYSVKPWSDDDDQWQPARSEDAGMRRTKFPTLWAVSLE